MSDNRQVTLAYPLEHDGKNYNADSTVWLPTAMANDLLYSGRARLPEPKSTGAKKAPAKSATTTATVTKES